MQRMQARLAVVAAIGALLTICVSSEVQGLWSPWSSWTSCSSTCGNGASFRARSCLSVTRNLCAGKQRQYRICQIGVSFGLQNMQRSDSNKNDGTKDEPFCKQPTIILTNENNILKKCPEDATPFRSMQCALYNFKSILGSQRGYQWVPFYAAPFVCDLNCLAVGQNFYYNFGRVLDGTRCGSSGGTCINGQCLNEGCDGILGSDASTDSCGRCGGKNDSCILIQRVFYDPFPSTGFFGYKNVTWIPAGASRIKVKDWSRNLLALMISNGRYVINGNWAVSWPGAYNVAGTVFHYNRTEGNHEILEAIGPTTEDLYIMVLFQQYNPGIEYEFWVTKETLYGNPRSLHGQDQEDMALDPLIQKTPHSKVKFINQSEKLRETTTAPRTGLCKRCTKPRGRSTRMKNYCQSDFVIRAKILSKRLIGQETQYDIQVKYVYKNKFPVTHREYIWVSNSCDCPELKEHKEYVLMATRHVNYEQNMNRILLSANSYVKPWSPHEDQQLWTIYRQCASFP